MTKDTNSPEESLQNLDELAAELDKIESEESEAGGDVDAQTEVQNLVWSLLDEQITETDQQRLEELISGDREAMRIYLQCVQMHADLQFHYANERAQAAPSTAPPIVLPIQTFGDMSNLPTTGLP